MNLLKNKIIRKIGYCIAFICCTMYTAFTQTENIKWFENICTCAMNRLYIDSFEKTENKITRNVFSYPKGVLLISSSQGWNTKLIKR